MGRDQGEAFRRVHARAEDQRLGAIGEDHPGLATAVVGEYGQEVEDGVLGPEYDNDINHGTSVLGTEPTGGAGQGGAGRGVLSAGCRLAGTLAVTAYVVQTNWTNDRQVSATSTGSGDGRRTREIASR